MRALWRCAILVLRLLYDDDLRLLLGRILGRSRRGNAELRAQIFSRVSAAFHDEGHNQGDAEDDATDGDAGFLRLTEPSAWIAAAFRAVARILGVEGGGAVKHVGVRAHLRGIPRADIASEYRGAGKHLRHVVHGYRIPRGERLIERRRVPEHARHGRHRADVPRFNRLIERRFGLE